MCTNIQAIASKLSKKKAEKENMRITRQLLDGLVSPEKSPHTSDESDIEPPEKSPPPVSRISYILMY